SSRRRSCCSGGLTTCNVTEHAFNSRATVQASQLAFFTSQHDAVQTTTDTLVDRLVINETVQRCPYHGTGKGVCLIHHRRHLHIDGVGLAVCLRVGADDHEVVHGGIIR